MVFPRLRYVHVDVALQLDWYDGLSSHKVVGSIQCCRHVFQNAPRSDDGHVPLLLPTFRGRCMCIADMPLVQGEMPGSDGLDVCVLRHSFFPLYLSYPAYIDIGVDIENDTKNATLGSNMVVCPDCYPYQRCHILVAYDWRGFWLARCRVSVSGA